MSNLFFFLVLKKTSNMQILNFLMRNITIYKIYFYRHNLPKSEIKLNLKFLVKKKKIFFLK